MKSTPESSWYGIATLVGIALVVLGLVVILVLREHAEAREYEAKLDAQRRSAEEMHLDAVGAPPSAYIRLELKWAREDREEAANPNAKRDRRRKAAAAAEDAAVTE